MRAFNASLGSHISVISREIIQGYFLSDKARALDLTPNSQLSIPCGDGPQMPSTSRCERTFFVPGGVDYAATQFANDSTQSDFFLAENQQGLVVYFREGEPDWVF